MTDMTVIPQPNDLGGLVDTRTYTTGIAAPVTLSAHIDAAANLHMSMRAFADAEHKADDEAQEATLTWFNVLTVGLAKARTEAQEAVASCEAALTALAQTEKEWKTYMLLRKQARDRQFDAILGA